MFSTMSVVSEQGWMQGGDLGRFLPNVHKKKSDSKVDQNAFCNMA